MNKFNIDDKAWFFSFFMGDIPEIKRGNVTGIKKDGNDIMYRFECNMREQAIKECYVFSNETDLKNACEALKRNKLALLEEEKDWVKKTFSSMVEKITEVLEAENETEGQKDE